MDENQTDNLTNFTEVLQQFPYPVFLLDDSNKILFSNNVGRELLPTCTAGNHLPVKYTSSHTVEIDGQVWNTFFEDGFLFLIPNLDTKKIILTQQIKDKETRVKTQNTILVCLSALIGFYLSATLFISARFPDIAKTDVMSANRETMALLVGAYAMALGSFFNTKENHNNTSNDNDSNRV
jgi:hypothetical protein